MFINNTYSFLFAVLIITSAILHLKADSSKNYKNIYIFKPLTLGLIILLAFQQTIHVSYSYKYFILTGLFFSMIGDIFLMLKDVKFTKGLLSFLIAHFFYIMAIVLNFGVQNNFAVLFLVILFFILFNKFIISKSGSKKLYITVYGLVIMFLLWQALSRFIFVMDKSAIFFGVGILLFTISDSILAYNKFVKKINNAQLFILTTYYSAQLLIAFSV